MNAKLRAQLQALPTSDAIWLCVVRRMPAWVDDGHSKPSRPWLVLIINVTDGSIVGDNAEISGKSLSAIVSRTLQSAMQTPQTPDTKPARPTGVVFERADMLEAQQADLHSLGIGTHLEPVLPEVDVLLRGMAASINQNEPPLGVIEILKHDLKAVRRFFASAAEFYRRAPWKNVTNAHVIEVRTSPTAKHRWAVVMGNGGQEFGIAVYTSLKALNAQFAEDDQGDLDSNTTQLAVLFNRPWDGPSFADLDAVELHGLELASEAAYPLIMRVNLAGAPRVQPGRREDLNLLHALLYVLPKFVLTPRYMDAQADLPKPATATLRLPAGIGISSLKLTFPAPGVLMQPPMRGDQAPVILNADDLPPELAEVFNELNQILGQRPKATKPAKRAAKSAQPGRWVQVKVSLQNSNPLIWRRLELPENIRLDKLHQVLQVAMGWTDSHMHHFYKSDHPRNVMQFFGPVYPGEDLGGPPNTDERTVRLNELIGVRSGALTYEYDFGDSWQHEIVIEQALKPSEVTGVVRCIDGARACPPEDSGGIYFYPEFLAAIADPKHPEHDELLEWVGGSFDAAAFDAARVSAQLKRIKLS